MGYERNSCSGKQEVHLYYIFGIKKMGRVLWMLMRVSMWPVIRVCLVQTLSELFTREGIVTLLRQTEILT